MGLCGCTGKADLITRETLQKGLAVCIENGDLGGLAELYDFFLKQGSSPYALPLLTVDDPVLTVQGVELNALAYSFRCGRKDIAQYLIEKTGASLSCLNACFQRIGKTPLHILCEYGHVDLLKYYLPLYRRSHSRQPSIPSFHESLEELSIFTDNPRRVAIVPTTFTLSPVQKACEKGYIDILRLLKEFAEKNTAFPEIDIHAKDEKTGENCALVSCRMGNLNMMKFLFEECQADFSLLNKRKESALQIALLSAKRHSNVRFFDCVRYLVEKIKVDVMYEYEETLLLIEEKALEEYLETRLNARGVTTTKAKVEENYAIISHKNRPTQDLIQLENRLKDVGTDFEMSCIFRTELQDSHSLLSSITPVSDISRDLSGTPVFNSKLVD